MRAGVAWNGQAARRYGHALARVGLGVALLTGLAVVLLSLPITARFLIERLEIFPALTLSELTQAASGPPTAIVVLSSGARGYAPEFAGAFGSQTVDALGLERLRYGAFVARQTGLPVLLTGGLDPPYGFATVMDETMSRDYGVKAKWIETRSRNTAENAIFSSEILKHDGIERVIVITHAWHMNRARRAFLANGMTVIPGPTAFYGMTERNIMGEIRPSTAAFQMSGFAIHESVGILWYRIRYGIR